MFCVPILSALVGLFPLMLGGLSTEEDSIMDRAITETYASKDITPETDFTGSAMPDFVRPPGTGFGWYGGGGSLSAQRMANITVKGTWSGFINQPTNVDINKKWWFFSIRDMEDELRPIGCISLLIIFGIPSEET